MIMVGKSIPFVKYGLIQGLCSSERCGPFTLVSLLVLWLPWIQCVCNTLRTHTHAIYRGFFNVVKMKNFSRSFWIFFLFLLQNIDCEYSLELPHRGGSYEYPQSMFLGEAVLTSTHNLCFGAKIRKIGCIPLQTPFFLYKGGVQEGIFFMDMFS